MIGLLTNNLDNTLYKWAQAINKNTSSRSLEKYFQQVLITNMNKAIYMKRIGAKEAAFDVLQGSMKLYNELKKSNKVNTLHICAKYVLTFGCLKMESGSINKALECKYLMYLGYISYR